MAQFDVAYKTSDGRTVRERINGGSRDELFSTLREEGLVPIYIKPIDGDAKTQKVKDPGSFKVGFFDKKVKLNELGVVFRTLSTMLRGGLPIIDSISDIGAQSDNPTLRKVFLSISADIREGTSFSAAMVKHPKVFSRLMIAMAHAGEESGKMGNILTDLADYLDTQVELQRKIKAGVRYPMFIMGFFILAVGVLFVFILPKFAEIFLDLDAELPRITIMVMQLSGFMANNLLYILLAVIALGVGGVMLKRTEPGSRLFDRFILRLPVIGPMAQKIVVARVSRTLGLLIDSGIPVVESLTLTGQISGNYVFRNNLEQIRDNIIRGSTLSEEMKGRAHFPMMLVRMTAAGETSGSLGDMLDKVATHYAREATVSIDAALALLEPVLLSLLGVVVGVVILAVYLPIFQLATAM